LVQQWLAKQSDEALFCASVGNDPSLCDLVRMVHPKPHSEARARLYAYLTGRKVDVAGLPQLVRQYEDFKRGDTLEVPAVPFEMLTTLPLGRRDWCAVAERAGWQMTRMNLNTFARHGVFEEPGMTRLVAARLRNADLIAKARVFPYQLMVAYTMAGPDIPFEVREALQDALEIATANVPAVSGQVVVCPDVSGSMSSPVTGVRRGATSTVRCIDVAALVAASLLRKNPGTRVLPFEQRVVGVQLNGRDSVMTNARVLAAQGGGGTNCSAPLAYLNAHKVDPDLVVFVSDNESWVDAAGQRGTEMMRQWEALRQRYAKARLVCIDLVPNRTTQAVERADILNIGGFSDQVFEVVAAFARGELGTDHWVSQIEAVDLRAA
jgi:60 kDa SS-A/Ro ribonucleoprotein